MTASKLIETSSRKTSNRPLVLLSAAFILQTAGALAADRAGDAQAQARELVSQSTTGRSAAAQSNALPDGGTSSAALDPQEQARRVLLGTPSAGGAAEAAAARHAKSTSPAAVVGRGHRSAHADAQEMARRVILGTVS